MTRFIRLMTAVVAALALLMGLPGLAGAATQQNVSYPVDVVVFNGCNWDPIEFTGTEHLVMRVAQDGSGTMHVGVTSNVENLKGVDLVDGSQYVGVSTSTNQASFTIDPYALNEDTIEAEYLMVSQGSGPNSVAHMLIHLTFDANGQLTAHTFTFTSQCRG